MINLTTGSNSCHDTTVTPIDGNDSTMSTQLDKKRLKFLLGVVFMGVFTRPSIYITSLDNV